MGPKAYYPSWGPSFGLGSFHQQYWLDSDKLIAVAVIDVLPFCVSSVYFYYDPDYSFLSLGTYSSLRELALTRQLQQQCSSIAWYYMGFYIHTCPKMLYKSRYHPSYLLCPETYSWHPVEVAAKKLDSNKYSRLEDDATREDTEANISVDKVLVLHERRQLRYSQYRQLKGADPQLEAIIAEYATLVGKTAAAAIMLYLP
ncbi:Arginine-tRNA-protein transferase C-terminal [Trinorchestia longiramus]|nr:Arginine-tRNA-protein transferase C-terminal [Trinorchestia longiramus]